MSHITREEVERIAALARLSLSEEEALRAAADLDEILGYVEQLRGVDTRGVEPTRHVMAMPTPLREDRPEPPLDPERAMANAPAHEGSAFVVPKVIEGEEEG